jgi:hypothetical protein
VFIKLRKKILTFGRQLCVKKTEQFFRIKTNRHVSKMVKNFLKYV